MRLEALMCTLALASSATPALAQGGAGDDQYEDPFGGQTGSSGSDTSGSGSAGQSVTDDPPVSLGGSGTQPPGGAAPASGAAGSGSAAQPRQSTGQLPDTGLEAPVVALLGLGLLVSGIGLRLRTVDDQLF